MKPKIRRKSRDMQGFRCFHRLPRSMKIGLIKGSRAGQREEATHLGGESPMQRSGFRRAPSGFTLVELLVVMAIIGILIAMLMPALGAVRERARRTQCNNNVKEIGTALQSYLESRGNFPAGNEDKDGTDISWLVMILPMIEGQNQYDNITLSEAWNSAGNQAITYTNFAMYRCPSIEDLFPGQGDYAGVDGSILPVVTGDASTARA
ncbi:MAG: DUF1559 domain-containing protein, partial [Pirellulales bacterium]|nr:DUF1559 domain-containing protein [Pirellulales bacterium]